MTGQFKFRRHGVAVLAGAMIALGVAGGASQAYSNLEVSAGHTAATSKCEVLATRTGNGTTLQAVFYADGPTQGQYRLSVESTGGGGRSSINQGGPFSASGPGVVALGTVSVGGSAYTVTLSVEANGQHYDCGGPLSA